MRRTIFMALLAALLFAVPAQAADPIEILRDCNDDSVLQGNYSTSDLRKASKMLAGDLNEYSDCSDVLNRAIADKTKSTPSTDDKDSGSGSAGGGQSGGSSGSSGGSQSNGDGSSSSSPRPRTSTPQPVSTPVMATLPENQQDWDAINAAKQDGAENVKVAGRDVSPLLTADIGRNGLPGTLVVALALLAAALLVALLPPLRRRVSGPRT